MPNRHWKPPSPGLTHLFLNKAEFVEHTASSLEFIEGWTDIETFHPIMEGIIDIVGYDGNEHCVCICRMRSSYQQIVYNSERLVEKYKEVYPDSRYHVISTQAVSIKWEQKLNGSGIHVLKPDGLLRYMRLIGAAKYVQPAISIVEGYSCNWVRA